jgi:hypothetical protein
MQAKEENWGDFLVEEEKLRVCQIWTLVVVDR